MITRRSSRTPSLRRFRGPFAAAFILACGALAGVGCNRTTSPGASVAPPVASQPAPQAKGVAPPAEVQTWTREVALDRLMIGVDDATNQRDAVWAALRLIELDQLEALVAPETLTEDHFAALRVSRLTPTWCVLGLALGTAPNQLRAPIFFAADGKIAQPVVGVEEELALLVRSADHEVFPHLLMLPQSVIAISDTITTGGGISAALALAEGAPVRLRLEPNDGAPFIAARPLDRGAPDREIARYTWDPFEMRFYGPAREKLAPDAEPTFAINLAASPLLVPRGGVVESPASRPVPESRPGEDENRIIPPKPEGVPL